VRSYIGVTDGEWFRFLAALPDVREVNFWRPSGGRPFGALTLGEPFFFKTHFPDNRVVGGGFYSDFAAMTASEALDLFGEGNGWPAWSRCWPESSTTAVSRWHRARTR
jgi:putative restriction endonuclease